MPHRFQRRKDKGYRLPEGVVCVTRPGRWQNPYETVEEFVDALVNCEKYLEGPTRAGRAKLVHMRDIKRDIKQLKGKDLACWCELGRNCHADILLEFANSGWDVLLGDDDTVKPNLDVNCLSYLMSYEPHFSLMDISQGLTEASSCR